MDVHVSFDGASANEVKQEMVNFLNGGTPPVSDQAVVTLYVEDRPACVSVLMSFGWTDTQANEMVDESYTPVLPFDAALDVYNAFDGVTGVTANVRCLDSPYFP